MIKTLKRQLAIKRLNRSLKPDPEYARHRLAQLTGERKERWARVVESL